MVVVDESREGTGQAHPHTDLIVFPLPCVPVLLQTHQTPGAGTIFTISIVQCIPCYFMIVTFV